MLYQQITHLIYCTLHFKKFRGAVKCHLHPPSLSLTRPASASRVCQTLVIINHNANVKNILHFSKKTRHFFCEKFAGHSALQIFGYWLLACLRQPDPAPPRQYQSRHKCPKRRKLKIREQVPVFNLHLLYLRCATAIALGLIAALAFKRYRLRLKVFIRI